MSWSHLEYKHDLTSYDYKRMYPGAPTHSEENRKFHSEKMKRLNARSDFAEARNKASRERLTRQFQDPVYKAMRSKRSSEIMKEWHKNNKELHSQRMRDRHADPWYKEKVRARAREAFKKARIDPAYFEMRSRRSSETMKKRWRDDPEGMARNVVSWAGKRHEYKGIMYRSLGEKLFAEFLTSLDYGFEYEPCGFKYEHPERGEATYIPDFYILDLDLFVEIKGDARCGLEELESKLVAVKRNGYEIALLSRREVEQLILEGAA